MDLQGPPNREKERFPPGLPVRTATSAALEDGHRCTMRLRINVDGRMREPFLRADCIDQITSALISAFITERVSRCRPAPKTANRHREVLQRLFNRAMQEYGVRMPGGHNPAAMVQRYRERASRGLGS
jgi:hypothetical protein